MSVFFIRIAIRLIKSCFASFMDEMTFERNVKKGTSFTGSKLEQKKYTENNKGHTTCGYRS